MRKRVESRSRQANWQHIQRAGGLCPKCGQERLDINHRTGRQFSLGPVCRQNHNAYMKLRRQS